MAFWTNGNRSSVGGVAGRSKCFAPRAGRAVNEKETFNNQGRGFGPLHHPLQTFSIYRFRLRKFKAGLLNLASLNATLRYIVLYS